MHEENNNKRKLFIDSTGSEKRNYTGDEDSERDFSPRETEP